VALLLCLLLLGLPWLQGREGPSVYSGMCDASAGIALDNATFVAADDERNVFCVYSAKAPGSPRAVVEWDANLGVGTQDEHPEADVEGATVLEKTIYWITSHGRNKEGKWRANRHRFFAMTIRQDGDRVVAEPVGKPYVRLALDLAADPRLKALGLPETLAPEKKKEEKLAPKDEGLNIEGLCAAVDGKTLLIGFRNPRPNGAALIVPLLNPDAVIRDSAAPKFGEPIRLPLLKEANGKPVSLGIRSMEYSARHQAYLIVAGAHDEQKVFAFYRWSGKPADKPEVLPKATAAIAAVSGFGPEALILYPGHEKVQLLSDDGSLLVRVASPKDCAKGSFHDGLCEAKDLLDPAKKTFRSLWVEVE
jgi:hypothetical protein